MKLDEKIPLGAKGETIMDNLTSQLNEMRETIEQLTERL